MTTFTNKETYLAARAEWKAAYAQLTLEARVSRAAFNAAQRAFSLAGSYQYGKGPDANKAYNEAFKTMAAARSFRAEVRVRANEALAERAAMKAEAARQWNEQRALSVTA